MSQKHYQLRKNPTNSLKAREAEQDNMSSSEHPDEKDTTQGTEAQTTMIVHSNSDDSGEDTLSNTEECQETRREDIPENDKELLPEDRPRGTNTDLDQIARMIMTINTKMTTMDSK